MKTTYLLAPLTAMLVLFSSCDWLKKTTGSGGAASSSKSGNEVLLSIEGQPAITVGDFENFYDMVLDQEPRFRQLAVMMPDLKSQMFNALSMQKILAHWLHKSQMDQNSEYKMQHKLMMDDVEHRLALAFFNKEHPVTVAEADVKKFYEDNKSKVYTMSPAGVNANAVSFDKEDAAKAFVAKAQQPGSDFNKVATDQKLTVRHLGRVNEASQNIEQALKDKVLGIKKFPSVQLFAVDKTFWVVQAQSKDEAKYVGFEQVKADAQGRLQQERQQELFGQEVEKLKKTYNVVQHLSYFEKKQEEQPAPQAAPAAPAAQPVLPAA